MVSASKTFPTVLRGLRSDSDLLAKVRSTPLLKFAIGMGSILLFAGIQKALWNILDPFAFSLFFAPIIFCALVGGFSTAFGATLFTVVVVHTFFLHPLADGTLGRS